MPIGKRIEDMNHYVPQIPHITESKSKAEELPPFDIFKGSVKSIKTGAEKIDELIDCIEEGMNIVYGEWDVGKTTFCLQVLMNAMEKGMKCRYIDTELGVHSKRLAQMYKEGKYSFPVDKLSGVFVRLINWGWPALKNRWINILEYDKPDLLIVDSITPVFLDTFFKEPESEHFKTLQGRDMLATTTLQSCSNDHVIVIIAGHEKAPLSSSGTVSEKLQREAIEFSGLGRRFAYLAKIWIYLFKENRKESLEKSNRNMVLLKHKYMPTFSENGKIVPIKITERGIET